ncbi:hypothetical protein MBLNU230_g1034t1 [Neophaeotheca triangularis]
MPNNTKHTPIPLSRQSICFPQPGTRNVLQHNSTGFLSEISRLYDPSENNAMEQLVALKTHLRTLSTPQFWSALTEAMSTILGAEMTFVFKRVLMDEQNAAVEMPPLGQQGSCMMAAAFYYGGHATGPKDQLKGFKFHAYGCPCAYMRHDKVFLIPERLNDFITDNPNKLPVPAEAYMAVPLFAQGKCFAHFGAMWSKEGLEALSLSWAFVEMLLHSLEDQVLARFMEGSELATASSQQPSTNGEKARVIPHEAVTAAQSLRPYAGSLSHELRTPMQGVVGMLDVMYATVQEAIDGQMNPEVRRVFEALKDNIEVVQDSSRRAVEAADNVVHAYDMDMSVPEKPHSLPMEDSTETTSAGSPFSVSAGLAAAAAEKRPEILVAGSNLPFARSQKRRRNDAFPSRLGGSCPKVARRESTGEEFFTGQVLDSTEHHVEVNEEQGAEAGDEEVEHSTSPDPGRSIAPGLRHADIRDTLQYVISEGLKMGGRPDSATSFETDFGERIEVRTRGSDGTTSFKTIDWTVDPNVPETMFIDEKDLSKLVSCVFLNAIKFADPVHGLVKLRVKMSHKSRYITLKISDNGPGIPPAFLPKLFKPFSQENNSITRQSEGLGLGLMVAKGIARKLGGDLICSRAETAGPAHGCEFEIKIPLMAGETISRPSSPFGSPLPRQARLHHSVRTPPLAPKPMSPARVTHALNGVVEDQLLDCFALDGSQTSSPLYKPKHNTQPPISSAVPSDVRTRRPPLPASPPPSDSSTATSGSASLPTKPTILAVTADVTDGALERAAAVGMKGFMTKPYKLCDLQRLIAETCARLVDE